MEPTDRHPSVEERLALGEQARTIAPLAAHAEWQPAATRRDPVELLIEQNATRESDLVPVRHGRMMVSPFTFYRGAAKLMAADLAGSPTCGLDVQLCGDAHLSNFGGFASPERELLFGLNDFDETLPGPFEYDVKRMSASFTIAAINNGFTAGDTKAVTEESARAYRLAMAKFATMRTLDLWYLHMSEQDIERMLRDIQVASRGKGGGKHAGKKTGSDVKAKVERADVDRVVKETEKAIRKAHSRDSVHALPRLAELVDGHHRIVSRPPVVIPLSEISGEFGMTPEQALQAVDDQFHAYRETLSDDRRQLLERFKIVDVARKVVGVGSVGTRAFIALLEGRDGQDPLFLQVKEATTSVLEDHLPKSRYSTSGERVVRGQRMMQAASDIFLGWTTGVQDNRFYYWRQLRDMKGSATVESMTPTGMTLYAQMCGWTLARAHARSGDPIAIDKYLDGGKEFEKAITAFSARYAQQNEHDYQAFVNAAADGRIRQLAGV